MPLWMLSTSKARLVTMFQVHSSWPSSRLTLLSMDHLLTLSGKTPRIRARNHPLESSIRVRLELMLKSNWRNLWKSRREMHSKFSKWWQMVPCLRLRSTHKVLMWQLILRWSIRRRTWKNSLANLHRKGNQCLALAPIKSRVRSH